MHTQRGTSNFRKPTYGDESCGAMLARKAGIVTGSWDFGLGVGRVKTFRELRLMELKGYTKTFLFPV